jgi:hypothetical protein
MLVIFISRYRYRPQNQYTQTRLHIRGLADEAGRLSQVPTET